MANVFNFSAGPAILPKEVLLQAQAELCDWQGLGSSVMEVSHRGKDFIKLAEESEQDLRQLLNVPQNYKILFFHGGARGQFAAIPLNLAKVDQQVDYICTGYWSHCAAQEAEKYCRVLEQNVVIEQNGLKAIQPISSWQLNKQSAYVHYCSNETIEGITVHETPNLAGKIVVADMSSNILSCPIDVSRFGLIYAGAQKNIGAAGITLVIVREDLIGQAQSITPAIFDYAVELKHDSMFNTPSTFSWYISALVFKWLKAQGGLSAIAEKNQAKSALLYQYIDSSDFYHNTIAKENRSWMNVTFSSADKSLDALFVQESEQVGFRALKGHRIAGGMRASLYNAMPIEGVQALIEFMKEFERRYG